MSLTNAEFLSRVRDYLPMEASVWRVDARGKTDGQVFFNQLEQNVGYRFDSESLMSVSHAIQDLALDEAKGRFLAALQDFHHFNAQRESYWQLAATLERVEVIGAGRRPRKTPHLRFLSPKGGLLKDFWIVLFLGHKHQAALVGRQANRARHFDHQQFTGFYTLNRHLIQRLFDELHAVLAGKQAVLHEFERVLAADRAAKQAGRDFADAEFSVTSALHRFRLGGESVSGDLRRDLGRAMTRLSRQVDRLPVLLEHPARKG